MASEIYQTDFWTSLPFNPAKLIFFIGWFYVSLFCVKKMQYSIFVPAQFKTFATLSGIVAGPVIFPGFIGIAFTKQFLTGNSDFITTIKELISSSFNNVSNSSADKIQLLDTAGRNLGELIGAKKDKSTLKLTKKIIQNGLNKGATDILIDPLDQDNYNLRLRIDGNLQLIDQLDTELCRGIINSIKVVSSMDIAEKRRPQDGSFTAIVQEKEKYSFRVASAGAMNGEKISIRILNQDVHKYTLDNIGLNDRAYSKLRSAIDKPSGMILICGPTGSGKTTTLFAMLNAIDFYQRNVITIEDPVEYVLPHISQISINERAGITFAKTLRSILRQDPDVIVVGEIRDEETASIALRAAQTGHLVLATIHCKSNTEALVRLLDLGVSPMLMSSGLSLLVSQRLVRQLCPNCKSKAELRAAHLQYLSKKGLDHTNIHQPVGCRKCDGIGYKDRMAVIDVLKVHRKLKIQIAQNKAFIEKVRALNNKTGNSSLKKQGLKTVVNGLTSLEELKKVIS